MFSRPSLLTPNCLGLGLISDDDDDDDDQIDD
jgi:hypothetical protein